MLKDGQIRKLSKSEAKDLIKNRVYSATMILERFEYAGKISESGYELRQKIVDYALSLLEKGWVDDD
jgi:hypothetical protein